MNSSSGSLDSFLNLFRVRPSPPNHLTVIQLRLQVEPQPLFLLRSKSRVSRPAWEKLIWTSILAGIILLNIFDISKRSKWWRRWWRNWLSERYVFFWSEKSLDHIVDAESKLALNFDLSVDRTTWDYSSLYNLHLSLQISHRQTWPFFSPLDNID